MKVWNLMAKRKGHEHQDNISEGKKHGRFVLLIRGKYNDEGREKHTPTTSFLWQIAKGQQ